MIYTSNYYSMGIPVLMVYDNIDAHPALKWAGGKRELIKVIDSEGYIPDNIDTYYEPFFGAGAVFFHLWNGGRIKKAVLSDLNFEIYNVHQQIKHNLSEMLCHLDHMDLSPSEDTYYCNRERFNELKLKENDNEELLERAILMIYLNRTAYSGMYRENKRGLYNVPFGYYKNPTIIDYDNLWKMNEAFRNVQFIHGDYEAVLHNNPPSSRDFVYFDPPYMPCRGVSEFMLYIKGGFNDDQQRRLSGVYKSLSDRGVRCMMSNSSSHDVYNLYHDIKDVEIKEITAKRVINAKNRGHNEVTEFLILNYERDLR